MDQLNENFALSDMYESLRKLSWEKPTSTIILSSIGIPNFFCADSFVSDEKLFRLKRKKAKNKNYSNHDDDDDGGDVLRVSPSHALLLGRTPTHTHTHLNKHMYPHTHTHTHTHILLSISLKSGRNSGSRHKEERWQKMEEEIIQDKKICRSKDPFDKALQSLVKMFFTCWASNAAQSVTF